MPFRKVSTNQPLSGRDRRVGWVGRRPIDLESRSAVDERRGWSQKTDMGKSLFRVIARGKSRSNVLYPRVVLSCWATARGTCARPLFEVCPPSIALSTTTRWAGSVGGASHGSTLLVHWKCEVEELNRISTSMPWKQAWGWDSFGITQSRAKIRTPVQSRNAI